MLATVACNLRAIVPASSMDAPAEHHSKERRSSANLERHIQTILISAITGALMFAANYIYSDNRSKAVAQTQLEVLTGQVIEMRADLRALQTNYVKREEYKDLEARVRALELQRMR
jgi:hypothetical protein